MWIYDPGFRVSGSSCRLACVLAGWIGLDYGLDYFPFERPSCGVYLSA
jgi:hypothetical protein